jgi:hypothetical protein
MASFFIVAFPWRFRLEDCDGNKLVLLGPFSALSASSPVRLTDPTISFWQPFMHMSYSVLQVFAA